MQTTASASSTDDQVEFPPGHHTKNQWLLGHDRTVKKNARPKLVLPYKSGQARLFTEDQTEPASPYDVAKAEYLRLFWQPFKSGKCLYGDNDGQSWTGHHGLPLDLVTKALQGNGHVGVWGRPKRMVRIGCIDLDCHLNKGANPSIFLAQCRAILESLWGKNNSQLVIAHKDAQGIHLIVYVPEPARLETITMRIRERLEAIHQRHPEIAAAVDRHNAQEPEKQRHVKHINELEIFPSTTSGFRIFGHRGKAVVAHKIISYVPHGMYRSGRRKGQVKYCFDLISWYESFDQPRMPLEDVLQLIRSRMPAHVPVSLPALTPVKIDKPQSPNPTPQERPAPEPSAKTSYRGRGKQLIVDYWSGADCPPNKLRERATFLIRLAKRSGWDQQKILNLLSAWARELPAEASSKIANAKWDKLDKDLARMIKDIYERGFQPQQGLSDEKLDRVLEVWSKQGFSWWDRETWEARSEKREIIINSPAWSYDDEQAIKRYLAPVLNCVPSLAVEVATGLVELVQIKEREGNGIGREYLAVWLKDKYGIKCGNLKKVTKIIDAAQELGLIEQRGRHITGRWARTWQVGERARRVFPGGREEGGDISIYT